jgi:tetratricopeptide (TPR) repeat protein
LAVKRVLGIGLLVAGILAGLYGYVATRQEARYLDLIEEGDAALARDDSVAAIEAFSVAIAIKPDSMAGHLKRGEAYRRRKEYESALQNLRLAVELDPLAPHPREILGDVNAAMGHYTQAVERYREYLALDDRAPRVLYKLGLALFETGQAGAATTELRKAIEHDDRFAEAHYLLGVCLEELQRPTQAIASLERALALDPALLHAREELASVYGRLNRREQQNRQLEALAGLDQRGAREVALALGYARDGQIDRAMLRLRSAAQHFPDDKQTHAAIGRLWLEKVEDGGDAELKKALQALETAIANDPTSEGLMLYARALTAAGHLVRAQNVLTQAVSRFPVDPLAFYYLADVAERRGKTRVAERALIDYAALEGIASPRLSADTLARIAEAQLKAGNLTAALQAAERAVRKDPDNAKAIALRERLK